MERLTKISANLEIGPRNFPLVKGFRTMFCGDPNCGPHLFLLDNDDQVFLEMIMSPAQVCEVERQMHDHHAGIPKS